VLKFRDVGVGEGVVYVWVWVWVKVWAWCGRFGCMYGCGVCGCECG
jgi:hypothetical protein